MRMDSVSVVSPTVDLPLWPLSLGVRERVALAITRFILLDRRLVAISEISRCAILRPTCT